MNKIILVDAWNTFVTEEGINSEMKKMLDNFSNKKIILTSANEEEKQKFGMINMPYELFTLAHNPEKTDSEYYKKMLSNFSLTSEDVIYFEHNKEAVESAKSVGINTFWYDKVKKDISGVKEFIQNNI